MKVPEKVLLRRMPWVLSRMRELGKKRGAAVHRAEDATKGDPFRILVFTMLSARTKDETTLQVVEGLFHAANTPKKIASLPVRRLESLLYGVGFYRVKAKHLKEMCRMLSGGVPDTLEGMLELPGVGRKTANIVLARAYGKKTLGVDVHVHRISNRLGLVRTLRPMQTEEALVRIIPSGLIPRLNREFVGYGQTICLPRNPKCGICPLNRICLRVGVREHCPECAHGRK